MRKTIVVIFSLLLIIGLSSFGLHKFYVSIYQINYNQNKQMLEITSRIFIDDLNDVLKIKYAKKTHLTEKDETVEDVNLMKKYLLDNFKITINGKPQTINFVNKETENNIIVCYFNVKNISKISKISIKNTSLFELNDEQQNIIQTNIYNKKEDLLLTPSTISGSIKF